MVIGAGYYATMSQMFVNYTVATIRMVSNVALNFIFALILFLLLEKPIENMKNMAYIRLFERRRSKFMVAQSAGQDFRMLKEVDEDVVEDLKADLTSKGL